MTTCYITPQAARKSIRAFAEVESRRIIRADRGSATCSKVHEVKPLAAQLFVPHSKYKSIIENDRQISIGNLF
jgi:hypothetical protein